MKYLFDFRKMVETGMDPRPLPHTKNCYIQIENLLIW